MDTAKSIRTEVAIYADDIYIYNQNRRPRFAHLTVQRHLHDVGRWDITWRTNISAEKAKTVVFSKETRLQLPELKLHNATIDYVPRACNPGP